MWRVYIVFRHMLLKKYHTFVAVSEFTIYFWRACLLTAKFYLMMCDNLQILIVDMIIYLQWLPLFILRVCRPTHNTWVIDNDLVITSRHECNLYLSNHRNGEKLFDAQRIMPSVWKNVWVNSKSEVAMNSQVCFWWKNELYSF